MTALFNIPSTLLFSTIFVLAHGGFNENHRNWALDGVKARLEKFICYCNPKYCTITTCNVKFKSRKVANLNFVATMHRTIPALNLNQKGYYKFSNNEYRPILLDTTLDYCVEQPGTSSGALKNFMKTFWRNNSNIFHPCPMLPGELYVKDWNFSASDLPNIIPAGRYLVNTTVYTPNGLVLNTSMYFFIANHGILDLNMG